MWNALTFRCVWRCVDSYAVSTQATEVTATTCSDLLSHYVQFSATGNEIFRLNIHIRLLQHLTWLQKYQVCMQAAITSAVSPQVLAVAMASYSCGLLLPACLPVQATVPEALLTRFLSTLLFLLSQDNLAVKHTLVVCAVTLLP